MQGEAPMFHQYPFIGIDIGKKSICISFHVPDKPPKLWPVVTLTYATDLDWHGTLSDLIDPNAIVCFEPTGYHLSAPVMNVVRHFRPNAQVWLAGHSVVGYIRTSEVAAAKTDEMDARTLALVAYKVGQGDIPRTVRRHNPTLDEHVQALRSLVNNRGRVVKTTTRLTNRLHAFAHAIHPMLDIKFTTWLALAHQGIIDPADIHAYIDSQPDINGQRLGFIKRLAAHLPAIQAPPAAYDEVIRTIKQLATADAQRIELDNRISNVVSAPPFGEVTRRLMTMPNATLTRIAPFHVASHGLLATMTPDEFKACCAIAALSNTSGSIDRTRAMKGGYKPAGTELYTWALSLVSSKAPDNPVKQYYQRLKSREDKNKEFRATRAKLAMLISGVARSPEGYINNG
jgi:hypothetical protein